MSSKIALAASEQLTKERRWTSSCWQPRSEWWSNPAEGRRYPSAIRRASMGKLVSRLSPNHKTNQRIYTLLRKRLVDLALKEAKPLTGEVEIDESYFGLRRVRGKRGRGAGGKTPAIGSLKRDGRVFTSVVANCSREDMELVIKGQVLSKATVYTGGRLGYDGLLLSGYKHHRIHITKTSLPGARTTSAASKASVATPSSFR